MLFSNAEIDNYPGNCVGSKFLVSTNIPACHHTRPLVWVTAVRGFGGTKTFFRAGRHPHSPAIGQVLIALCRGRWSASHKLKLHRSSEQKHTFHNWFELHLSCILTLVQRCFCIMAQQHSQIFFEFRIQQDASMLGVKAYSSSPHIPNKSFAFY